MSELKLDFLKQQYKEFCTSKSTSSAILELYHYILKNENTDSDWWNEDHGAGDIIKIFETIFTPVDWAELKEDLKNWTTFQLELLTQSIMGGYGGYLNNNRQYYYPLNEINRVTQTLSNRLSLITTILEIEKSRNLIYNDLSHVVAKEIDFIIVHFEILLRQDLNNFKFIKEIVNHFDSKNFNNDELLILKMKVKNIDKASS